MNISIVIPNWNGKELLQNHLPAVLRAAGKSEVIVVDDASTDDSISILAQNFPSIHVVKKEQHDGFANTVNAGVIKAKGEIVVLLNTDVAPQKDFLKPLISHFEDPLVFAVGAMDKSIESGRTILRGRGIARWRRGFYVHNRGDVHSNKTAWVSGGSGAFRKSMWDELSGMDTLFDPFYWEDIDLSYRALKAGYKLVFENKSIVVHHHEEGKVKQTYSPFVVRSIAARNQFQFIWKNTSDVDLLLAHIVWTPLVLVRAILRFDFAFVLGYTLAALRLSVILKHRLTQSRMWRLDDRALLPLIRS